MSIQPVYGIGSKNRHTNRSPQNSEPSKHNRRPYSGCGCCWWCSSSDGPWWSPFRRDRSGCLVLLALILELQSAKVNSQIMDIPVRKAYKVCWIFTKLNGFLTRANGFSYRWHHKTFWKQLEAPRKRDLQTPPFLLP